MAAPVVPQNPRVRFAPLPTNDAGAATGAPARPRTQHNATRLKRSGASKLPAKPAETCAADREAPVTSGTHGRPAAATAARATVPVAPSLHAPQRSPSGAPPAYVAPPAYQAAWAAMPPPSYIATRGWDRSSQAMEWAVERVHVDVDRWLASNPARRRMVHTAQWVGALAAVGGTGAAACAATAGAISAITGVGLPAAGLAAVVGLGAGAGGLALVAVTAYATQLMLQKAVKEEPMLAQKLTVLREMRGALRSRADRSPNDEALLHKVEGALAYAGGGVSANVRHEANRFGRGVKGTWVATAGLLGNKKAKATRAQEKTRHTQRLDFGRAGERWFRALTAR